MHLSSMRRGRPFPFVAFDVLAVNGNDLRRRELLEREEIMRAIVPKRSSVILCSQHIVGRGVELYRAVCERDLEGIRR